MNRRRRAVAVITAVALVVVVVLVGWRQWQHAHRTGFEEALDAVPRSTLRMGYTDWAAIREHLGLPDARNPSDATIAELTSKGYDSDLSAASSIDESTAALQQNFGFSAATAQWEAYAQARDGATMVLRMPDDVDLDRVTEHLDDLGFTKPSKDTGVWKGGVDLVASIDPTITPELQYVAVLADKHLIVTSDEEKYAEKAAAVAQGDADSLADAGSADDLAHMVGEPAAAMLWSGDFACDDLSMSQADEDSQAQADDLVSRAGKVTPLSGLVMTLATDRTLTVGALFEDSAQAKENLEARARLAVGEAPGRGGRFSDDLTLVSSRTEGPVVVLRLRPKERSGFVLSALDNGPVLFATC